MTRRVAWPVTWAWGHPERQPRPRWPPRAPTLVLLLPPHPARRPQSGLPSRLRSTWEALRPFGCLVYGNSLSTYPEAPPVVTLNSPHLSGLEPVVSMHPKTPKTFLRVQRLGLRPLLFCLPPPPRVRGARPSPSVGRPPAAWAQVRGLLRARGPRAPFSPHPPPNAPSLFLAQVPLQLRDPRDASGSLRPLPASASGRELRPLPGRPRPCAGLSLAVPAGILPAV